MQTATADAPAAGAMTDKYELLPIAAVFESPTNPRTHFDDAYIGELAGSIREKGLIQPIIVRPKPAKLKGSPGVTLPAFEIVAGACRYRGSKLAGLAHVRAIVREMTDNQVLEAQLEENIHRKDLTPLEEAAGYRRLIASNPDKHSAESIATRIGMSVGYVWDRLKLNDLIPEAKAILERELMTVGHAILIARLKPEDQQRTIEYDDDRSTQYRGIGLWRDDQGMTFDEDERERKKDKYAGLKPCSVRELEAWIRDHIRFDVAHAAQAQPLVFEQTAQVVEQAAAQPGRGKKVIAITHEYRVADDARAENERTYGSQSWKRADGQAKSKTCDHSVLGVVVAGEGYGDTLKVCVARDKCEVHFGDVLRQKRKNEKLRESGQTAKASKRQASYEEEERKRREKEEREDARWKAFFPALKKAVADARGKLKTLNGPLYQEVLKTHHLPAGTKPADLAMAMLDTTLKSNFNSSYIWRGHEARLVAWAKLLGVDVKGCEPEPEKKPAAPAKATAKKTAGKKR